MTAYLQSHPKQHPPIVLPSETKFYSKHGGRGASLIEIEIVTMMNAHQHLNASESVYKTSKPYRKICDNLDWLCMFPSLPVGLKNSALATGLG